MTAAALARLLVGAAAVLAAAGVGALAWPARVDVAPRADAEPDAVERATAVAAATPDDDSALVAAVIATNLFSDSRRPPATRYDPLGEPGAEPPAVYSPPAVPPDVASSDAPPDTVSGEAPLAPSPVPRLFGIVADAGAGGGGGTALLRLDPRLPGARAYRAGDRGGAYRVVRVDAAAVILDGPGGRRTLRLATPSTPR